MSILAESVKKFQRYPDDSGISGALTPFPMGQHPSL
jgi:hypothetical protein